MVNPYKLLATAFFYPDPGKLAELQEGLEGLAEGAEGVKGPLQAFLDLVGQLSLAEWEELYTRTFDLSPLAAPYVGFQAFGDAYLRGVFLAKMGHALAENGIDREGELPDHLAPVLRYLGQAPVPLPELVEVLVPAIQRMQAALRSAEPGNPYLDLLEAAQAACKELKKEAT